jgi:hypothetical protein
VKWNENVKILVEAPTEQKLTTDAAKRGIGSVFLGIFQAREFKSS